MISVLMNVYKKENPTFLKASLDSIYAQTLKADEIVLVKARIGDRFASRRGGWSYSNAICGFGKNSIESFI